jgi:hypothetical protein
VSAVTRGLFQDPSSGIASKVLPTFQPGLIAAIYSAAVIGSKDPVHSTAVCVGAAVEVLELVSRLEEDVLVGLTVVVDESEPGTHCEYPEAKISQLRTLKQRSRSLQGFEYTQW